MSKLIISEQDWHEMRKRELTYGWAVSVDRQFSRPMTDWLFFAHR
jgi:hypothetical protein